MDTVDKVKLDTFLLETVDNSMLALLNLNLSIARVILNHNETVVLVTTFIRTLASSPILWTTDFELTARV